MQTICRENVVLHIREDGPKSGRAVMFANSLGTDLRVWEPMLAHMPADLRLIRYDKRGHGLSDCPAGPYDLETLVTDAEHIARGLELKNITFVGLSIGGLIGQGLALKRPDLLSGLVLMDTAAQIGTPEMWTARIAALRQGGIEPMAETILDRWFSSGMRADAARIAPWRNMLCRTPLEGYLGCCSALAAADLRPEVQRAAGALAVTAMVGAEDGATPPQLVQDTAALWQAECHTFANAGHLPCVEAPERCAGVITDFMERTRL